MEETMNDSNGDDEDENRSDEVRKGDEILRRLLKTPPQPKEAAPKGKTKPKPKPKKKPAK